MNAYGFRNVTRHLKAINCKIFLKFMIVIGVCIGFAGCRGRGDPGPICFSPDGSTLAYTCVKRIDLPLPPEMPTLYSTVYLQWC